MRVGHPSRLSCCASPILIMEANGKFQLFCKHKKTRKKGFKFMALAVRMERSSSRRRRRRGASLSLHTKALSSHLVWQSSSISDFVILRNKNGKIFDSESILIEIYFSGLSLLPFGGINEGEEILGCRLNVAVFT